MITPIEPEIGAARSEFTVSDAHAYNLTSPLRWILSHILRYPYLPAIAALGAILTDSLYSLIAVLIGQAFDLVAAPDATPGKLLNLTLLILGIHLVMGVTNLSGAFAAEFTAQRVERDAREELYISLLGKSQTFHNRQHVGDIMARATNDVHQLNLLINPGVSLIFDSLMSTIIPLVTIGLLRAELLIVPLLFLIVFAIALRSYNRDLTPVTLAQRTQFGVMNTHLAEAIAGIEVVKAYAQEEREFQQFTDHARRFRDLFVQEGKIKAAYLPLLLYGVTYGLAFGHAMLLFLQGSLSVGQVVAFMGLMAILNFPTFISLFSFALAQIGRAGAERILTLIKTRTELDENAGGVAQTVQGAITFDHVTFEYDGEPMLKDMTFHALPGETIAIVGQTGSGKTTLTRLVNRIYDASRGRVLIDGRDVREWSLQSLRSQISTIEQDVFLFSRTVAENIAFGASDGVTHAEIEQAAREAQAHEFIQELPHGYDTVVGERGVTLSGGQRQRIAIARAFLTNPRILILDDSTSAIDSATEDQIQHAIRRILQGRTTLLITHRISQIRWADRILVLRRGELAAQGTHEELMAHSEAYRRIFARYV
ncbi:MAG: ABC transporter ATP-binding protein [Chloroflexaceae bacterium]|nr:ABC transporter ATP-binding protein [Chloroflexaceae bacterium]